MNLVALKQEVERRSEWFCYAIFFQSNFNVERKHSVPTTVRFSRLWLFVHMRLFSFDFCYFYNF